MLGKYRGITGNVWLEDVISNLELRFGVKSDGENLISFQQNSGLKGLEYLSTLIDATINHQSLEITYTTHTGISSTNVLHPYYMKQYNNRWFIFGRIDGKDYIVNRALDRIEGISKSDVPFRKNDLVNFNSYFDDIVGLSVIIFAFGLTRRSISAAGSSAGSCGTSFPCIARSRILDFVNAID